MAKVIYLCWYWPYFSKVSWRYLVWCPCTSFVYSIHKTLHNSHCFTISYLISAYGHEFTSYFADLNFQLVFSLALLCMCSAPHKLKSDSFLWSHHLALPILLRKWTIVKILAIWLAGSTKSDNGIGRDISACPVQNL